MEELAADAAVETDPFGDVLQVGVAQIGDFVDERHFGREEGIGGVLDQFGCLVVVNTIAVSIR
jgi:hypothetical protein